MNAKEELLGKIEQINKWLGGTKIICATITHEPFGCWNDEHPKPHVLKQGHDDQDYMAFIASLDFEYDSGYGSQELFGTVWFTNGIWMDRHEYDGSEYWDIHRYPTIPSELQ
jgi:hypothetical protein